MKTQSKIKFENSKITCSLESTQMQKWSTGREESVNIEPKIYVLFVFEG